MKESEYENLKEEIKVNILNNKVGIE